MTGTDLQDLLESEQRLGQDILELWHIEYSYKAIKTILPFQQQVMQNVQLMLTAPVQYGAQPNLAFYSKPDGPGRQLVRAAAARRHRRRARGHRRGHGVRHQGLRLRRRGHARGRRRRHGLRHHRRRRRRRLLQHAARREAPAREVPGRRHRGRHGRRVRDRRARRARVGGPPARRPVAEGAARGLPGRRRHHLRAGGEHPHRQELRLERRLLAHRDQAVHGRGAHPRASQRRRGRRAACR